MAFRVISILLSASFVSTAPFQPVSSSCIYWDLLNLYPNGDTEKLHCIVDEKNQLGIVSVEWKWVEQGSCPYYDRYSKQIHVRPCDAKLGSCPDKDIFSYQAVKYSACMKIDIRNRTSSNVENSDEQVRTTTTLQLLEASSRQCRILTAISVFVSILILIMLVGVQIKEIFKQRIKARKGGTLTDKVNRKLMNGNIKQETEVIVTYGSSS